MSVDLVGSTAYKAKYKDQRTDHEPYPIWLNRTKSFYRQFPQMLTASFSNYLPLFSCSDQFSDRIPQVWKTVGDEIIFCVRLTSLEHLAACTRCFVATLADYGKLLQSSEPELDVKGSAWIASFPAPNATIISASRLTPDKAANFVGDQLDESQELDADRKPGEFDFLGKSIDTGFRVSRFAQASELVLSIELAWLLLLLKQRSLVDFEFIYKGRESLKGVINNNPYPIVAIETERSVKRKELYALERTVSGTAFAEKITLRNYLYSFMEQHEIEIPVLTLYDETADEASYPTCLLDFRQAWARSKEESTKRDQSTEAAENFEENLTENKNSDRVASSELESFADKLIRIYISRKEDDKQ